MIFSASQQAESMRVSTPTISRQVFFKKYMVFSYSLAWRKILTNEADGKREHAGQSGVLPTID
jgi:hypothetical protein